MLLYLRYLNKHERKEGEAKLQRAIAIAKEQYAERQAKEEL